MQRYSTLNQARFDRWLGGQLKTGLENIQPPEHIWQVIIHRLCPTAGSDQSILPGEEKSGPLCVIVRTGAKIIHTLSIFVCKGLDHLKGRR